MPSYVVTGTARGIGWAFLEIISKDPENQLFGLVRDKAKCEKRVAETFPDRKNITILQADLADYKSLEKASQDVAAATGGKLDYLINNGAMMSRLDGFLDVELIAKKNDPEVVTKTFLDYFQTNAIGTYHLFTFFTPLLQRGTAKKATALTSGHADLKLVNVHELENNVGYSSSKAALNMVVAKFHARYAKEGLLFMSICPGVVDTDAAMLPENEEEAEGAKKFIGAVMKHNPEFKGLQQAPVVAEKILSLLYDSTPETQGGQFVSHSRTDKWVV